MAWTNGICTTCLTSWLFCMIVHKWFTQNDILKFDVSLISKNVYLLLISCCSVLVICCKISLVSLWTEANSFCVAFNGLIIFLTLEILVAFKFNCLSFLCRRQLYTRWKIPPNILILTLSHLIVEKAKQKTLPTEAIPVLNASTPVKITQGQLRRYKLLAVRLWWFCCWQRMFLHVCVGTVSQLVRAATFQR